MLKITMDRAEGFTIIELITVIIIIGILMTVGVVIQQNTIPVSRDNERAEDIASIARLLEADYNTQVLGKPAYPVSTVFAADAGTNKGTAARTDAAIFTAPNATSVSLVAATSSDPASPVGAGLPAINKYYYQPIARDGSLCNITSKTCVLYRLLYLRESDKKQVIIKSEHQQ